MSETAITLITPEEFKTYQLSNLDRIYAMRDIPEFVAQIGRGMPGKMTTNERKMKARALVEQVHIALANSKNREEVLACGGDTILECVIDMAYLGLSPLGAMGEGYFIPRGGACTLMIGYKGFRTLIYRTGKVATLESVLVYDSEEFKHWRDEGGPHWKHPIDLDIQGQYDHVVGCYCWASMVAGGPPMFELMNKEQLEKVRQSGYGGSPAYKNWLGEMYRKAPLRRLAKWMELEADSECSDRYARALQIDNAIYNEDRIMKAQVDRAKLSLEMIREPDKPLVDAGEEQQGRTEQ